MLPGCVISCLLAFSLLPATSSLASHAQFDDSEIDGGIDDPLESRQSSTGPYAITGISGTVYPRLEVRTLFNNNPIQWNLYLLGLQQFMKSTQDRRLSFYQIAGIHGVPNIPWDNVQANPSSGGAVGYCTHSSVLFPAWHRPYVALFEQVLMHHVKNVVKSFPAGSTRNMYAAAAATMRVPYWDWAAAPASGPTYPLIFGAQHVTVVTHKGQQTIPNPLFQYTFHPLNPGDMLYQPWSEWPTTLRWPTVNTTGATSQNDQAQAAIETSRINRRDSLYNMFVNCKDYLEFSNDAASSSTPGCSASLESIHNSIHSLVGGQNDGHMTWLWWSAFDPVFFLHHTNVDRLFAMWQAVYPDNYGASQNAPGSTFTIAQGSLQGPNSPLEPFHADSSGSFWTTNGVRDWQTFGYTYPEFADSDGSASSIRAFINRLYGPSANATAGSSKAKRGLNFVTIQPLPEHFLDKTTTDTGATREYTANIVAPRFALNGSYGIYIFMGGPSDESEGSGWPFDEKLIGSVNILAAPNFHHNKMLSSGSVPLTRALTTILANKTPILGKVLVDMDKQTVVPFLKTTLEWRVSTANNQIIDPADIPGFEISVVTSEAQPATSENEFPNYSPFHILPDITHGKKGGLKVGSTPACEAHGSL